MKPNANKLETKQVWIAWTNTDLTEGRGWEQPLCISESRATALRLGKKGYVMGSDCRVEPFNAVKIDGRWLAPVYIVPPTTQDAAADRAYKKREAAIDKALAAGIDTETLNDLMTPP
jgi:hypothetical protein